MANEGLKAIYDKVFRKVKANPQVQGLERGLLYKVVQIILEEEQSQSQVKTREICGELNIKPSSNRDDDYKVIEDLIKAAVIDRQVIAKFIPGKDVVSDLSMKINLSCKNEEEKMEWVVIAACILVGVYFCLQYLRNTKQKQANQEQKTELTQPLSPPPIPAALCLVVPAKVASDLQVNAHLSSIDVENLISNASYFLSTSPAVATSNEQRLNLTDEYILSESQRDVYLRIDTDDGRDIIDKKILYGLKSNLSPNAGFVVKQVACLKSLSGLEVFNRV